MNLIYKKSFTESNIRRVQISHMKFEQANDLLVGK